MIQAVGFLDTMALSAALYRQRNLFDTDARLDLGPILKTKEWGPAKNVVAKALGILTSPKDGKPALTAVQIDKISPMTTEPWTKNPDWAQDHMHFIIPILTNPLVLVYSGIASGHVPIGQLTFIETGVNYSASNNGDLAAYHLLIDVKRYVAVNVDETTPQ